MRTATVAYSEKKGLFEVLASQEKDGEYGEYLIYATTQLFEIHCPNRSFISVYIE